MSQPNQPQRPPSSWAYGVLFIFALIGGKYFVKHYAEDVKRTEIRKAIDGVIEKQKQDPNLNEAQRQRVHELIQREYESSSH